MLEPAPLHTLWGCPMGVFRYAQADAHNDTLSRVLRTLRVTDPQADPTSPFWASGDDLLQRIRLPEWQSLMAFVVDALRQTVVLANQGAWTESRPGMQLALRGLWAQASNRGRHHDVHTHGNCSWSGVYCVQVDATATRRAHPAFGAVNGVTRFYGPHFNRQGGAFMDFGNAYLQQAHLDIDPVPGQLIIFPSWLPHQAMPYEGEQDRLILSFNASVHAAAGSDQQHGYSST